MCAERPQTQSLGRSPAHCKVRQAVGVDSVSKSFPRAASGEAARGIRYLRIEEDLRLYTKVRYRLRC